MAAKKEELFNEEFLRVEQELKQLQLELGDLQKQHDDLHNKLDDKEKELDEKDGILSSIKEANKVELVQLAQEAGCVKERVNYEVQFHMSEVASLKHRILRLFELRAENERLQSTVSFLEENINNDRRQHALQLHEMNKSMKEHRQHMESKLRKDLNGMDISFQNQAFSALHDRQKRAMFRNAKLKDEVAIQGIGISNLTTRLAKQQVLYETTRADHAQLVVKSEKLKHKLGIVSTKRNLLVGKKQNLADEIESLRAHHRSLVNELKNTPIAEQRNEERSEGLTSSATSTNTSATAAAHAREKRTHIIPQLLGEFSQLKQQLREHEIDLELWKTKQRLLHETLEELKPTTVMEKSGLYEAQSFPLYPLLQEIHSLRRRLRLDAEHGRSAEDAPDLDAHWFKLREFAAEDPDLLDAFQMIKAHEHNILVACHKAENHHASREHGNASSDSAEQNMVAWTTLKILIAWYKSKLEAEERESQLILQASHEKNDLESSFDSTVDSESDVSFDKNEEETEDHSLAGELSADEKLDSEFPSNNSKEQINEDTDGVLNWLRNSNVMGSTSSLLAVATLDDVGPPVVRRAPLPVFMSSATTLSSSNDSSLSLRLSGTSSARLRSAKTPSLPLLRATDPLLHKKGLSLTDSKMRRSQSAIVAKNDKPPLPVKKGDNALSSSTTNLRHALSQPVVRGSRQSSSTGQLPSSTARF